MKKEDFLKAKELFREQATIQELKKVLEEEGSVKVQGRITNVEIDEKTKSEMLEFAKSRIAEIDKEIEKI